MREISRSRLRPPPRSQPQRRPGVLAGGRPNLRSCFCSRLSDQTEGAACLGELGIWSHRPPFPPNTTAELCAPGSGKSLAQGGDNIESRAVDRSRGLRALQHPPGNWVYWKGPGGALKPPWAGSIPSACSPESRRPLKPRAPPASQGALSPAGPGDAAVRGLDTKVRRPGKLWWPSPSSRTWSPELQAPRVREGSSHSCKEGAKYVFQTFHGSKLSASIKRSGVRGKAFWVLACK
uniref:Uncharacterized protein n=1 Tax=Suricata suricatta TaxID=37032 RepID=A0A673UI13_SURSU